LDEVLHNCEPEAKTARFPRRRRIFLAEAFEDVRNEIRRHALSCVRHGDRRLLIRTHGVDEDLAPRWSEFYGVGQQGPNDLLEPIRVGLDRFLASLNLRDQRYAARFR